MKHGLKRLRDLLLFLSFNLCIISCPTPIDTDMLLETQDIMEPVITVLSPQMGSFYGFEVAVAGLVTDDSADQGDGNGQVESLSYSLLGTQLGGDISLGGDGSFSFLFSTVDLTGELLISITAEDWNGNQTEFVLRLTNDQTGPYITISSPPDLSFYPSVVVVQGTVRNCAAEPGQTAEVQSLNYEIVPTAMSGPVSFNDDGAFQFTFSTGSCSGPVVVRLSAEDWNGNVGETSVTLVDGGSDVPSFVTSPGNGEIQLTWDPVPMAESYSVYYTCNNSYPNLPDGSNGTEIADAASGVVIDNLENGSMHVLQLHVHMPAGFADSWSDYAKAVPLSELTLTPKVSDTRVDGIHLRWKDVPADVPYEIWRSETGEENSFYNLAGSVSEAMYVDKAVEPSQVHYYRIKLESYNEQKSMAVPGQVSTLSFENTPVGSLAISETIESIAYDAARDRVLLSCGGSGALLFDVSIKNAPVLLADASPPGTYDRMVVEGNYAFAMLGDDLAVLDLSGDPPLAELGRQINAVSGSPGAIAVDLTNPSGPGNFVYIPRGSSLDVWEVDFSIPTSPSFIGRGTCGGMTGAELDAKVTAGYAYFIGQWGQDICDVSDPDLPARIGGISGENFTGIAVSGTDLYVTKVVGNWLEIYDVTVPSNPTLTGSSLGPMGFDVELSGDRAYIRDWNGVSTVDVSDTADPELSEVCTLPAEMIGEGGPHCTVSGEFLYTYGVAGLEILNIGENMLSPVVTGSLSLSCGYLMAMQGDTAYIESATGFSMISVSDPAAPEIIANIPLASNPNKISVEGHFVYLILYEGGRFVQIVDVSDPENPEDVASIAAPTVCGIYPRGDFLYSSHEDGFRIYEISDPSTPLLLSTLSQIGAVDIDGWIEVQGNEALVSAPAGLFVVDISIPTSPVVIRQYPMPLLFGFDAADDRFYGWTYDAVGFLTIQDLSVSQPPKTWPVYDDLWPAGFGKVSDYLYVGRRPFMSGTGEEGMLIFKEDLSGSLVRKGSIALDVSMIWAAGDYVYSCDATDNYLRVIEVNLTY